MGVSLKRSLKNDLFLFIPHHCFAYVVCVCVCLRVQQSRVITLCAYRDVSGMFTIENKVAFLNREETVSRSQSESETLIHDLG